MNLEHVHPAPKSGLGRCPYCHEGIDSAEVGLWSCPGCGAHHHLDCLEDFGTCAVYGCSSAAPIVRTLTPSAHVAARAQRRARSFTRRHQTRPRRLDPEWVALAQRISAVPRRRWFDPSFHVPWYVHGVVGVCVLLWVVALCVAATL